MSELRELYQEVILDHNKSPRNFRAIADADRKIEGYNPLCGDHYTIYLKFAGEVIEDVSFEGAGCAISKASASVVSLVIITYRKPRPRRTLAFTAQSRFSTSFLGMSKLIGPPSANGK